MTKNTSTSTTNTQVAAAMPSQQISAVGLSGTGGNLRKNFDIQLVVIDKGNQTQQFNWLREPGQGPALHVVKPNTKLSLKIDGQPFTGKEQIQGKNIRLKKVNSDLLIETDTGEALVYLDDFYQTTDVMLTGADWSFAGADALRIVNANEGVMASTNLIAASSGAGWLGAGLGVAVGAGGGGGGAAGLPTVFKLVVTAVAGPFKNSVLMILTTEDGQRFSAVSDANGRYTFDIPAGYKGTLLVSVKDLNGDSATDFMDEATGAAKSLVTQMRAMLVVDNTKNVSITVSPATELAARQAGLGDGDTAKAPAADVINKANADVAKLLGLVAADGKPIDIVQTLPTLIINADGSKNTAYNDADGVSPAEKYAQVLAMLSGLDKQNGGSIDATLDSLQALVKTDNTAALTDQLIEGAKVFEANTAVAGMAKLWESDGASNFFPGRVFNAPTAAAVTKATTEADSMAGTDGGELAKGADGKRHINTAEAADGIVVPTALPSAAVAGDVVTLTITNADGTTTLVPYTLTPADILAGVAQVPVSKAQLGADGEKAITAAVQSADGSITSPSFPVPLDFSLDTTAPLVNQAGGTIGAMAATGNDVGSRDAANFTSDKTPTISGGPVEAGATVEVTLNGKTYSSTGSNPAITIAADGTWTLTVPDSDALAGSGGLGVSYVPVVKVTDAAGNSSTANGTPFAVYVDVGGGLETSSDTAGPAGSGGTATDNITQDSTPTISGKVPVGTAIVSVVLGGKTYSTAATDPLLKITLNTATGEWNFTAQTLTADGAYTPVITLKDQVGNVATVSGTPFTLDTTGPASTGISGGLASGSDTGDSADGITSNDRPTFTGRGEPGTAVSVVVGGVTLTGTVAPDGTWSLSWPAAPAAALADTSTDGQGTKYTPQITLTDAAGNATTQAGTEFTLDTTGPTGSTGGLSTLSDGAPGTAADNLTNDDTPVLSGTAEKGAKVEVTINGKTYTTTADPVTGAWSVPVTDALPDNTTTGYIPSIKVTDAAGNSTITAGAALKVDTAPVLEADISGALQAVAGNDTGTLSDNLTSNRLPTLTGKTEIGSKVEVTVAGKTYTAVVDASGNWSVPVGSESNSGLGLSNGFYTPQIKVTDAAGNITTQDGTDFQIDFTAPSLQGITGGLTSGEDSATPANDNDSGTKGDNLTRDTTPTLSGTGEPGSTVVVTLKSSVAGAPDIVLTGVTVGPDGTWSAAVTAALADATYTPSVVATDVAGNASAPKAITPFTIDATAPVAPVGKLAFVSDTGVAETKITKLQNPNLQGDAEANSVVELKITVDGTERTYTTTANSLGKWTVELTGDPLPNGTYTYTLSSTDKAGNVATATMTDNFTVDTNSASGNAGLATVSDTAGPVGTNGQPVVGTTADRITKTTKPVIEGLVDNFQPSDIVEVTLGGLKYSNAAGTDPLLLITVTSGGADNGKWSFTVRDDLTEGDHVPSVAVTTGGTTTTLNGTGFTVDTTAPDLGVTAALTRTAANDTGLVGDNLTKVIKPLFNGTAESGASITLQVKSEDGSAVIATVGPVTVGANGQWATTAGTAWAFTDANLTELPTAKYTLNAVVTDRAGNVTTTALPGNAFEVDATGPSTGGFTGALADTSNTGSTTDTITSATRPTLTGKAEAGAKVEVTIGANTYTAFADDQGNWSVAVTTALSGSPATEYKPTVKLTDAAGNVTTIADAFAFTVNTVAPLASAISGVLSGPTGNDGTPLSNDNTPTLSGTAPAGSVVEVTIGGVTYTNASPTPAGMTGGLVLTGTSWTLPVTTSLTDGVQVPQIKVTDSAGNSTTANGTAFRVDTAAPIAQTISGALTVDADTTAAANDSGTKGDNLTRDTTPTLNGTSEPGGTVTVVLNSSVSGATPVTLTVTTQPDGTWTAVLPSGTLADATYTPKITVTDKAGNATNKDGTPFTIDATAPSTPLTGGLAASSDTGVQDGKTNDTTPTLTGTAEAGAKVVITLGGKTYETTASPTGTWSITADDLGSATATYTPQITVTDKAGNVAGPTNLTPFTIDTTAPVVNGGLETGATATTNSGDNTDTITSNPTPKIVGTAEAGAAVEVTIDSVIYKATASPTGAWSITIGTGGVNGANTPVAGHTLANGTYIPRIKVTNSVGVSTTADGTSFTVDFIAPALTSISGALTVDVDANSNLADDNDSGTKNDNTTRDTTPTFNGTAELGSTVKLYVASSTATATTFKTTAQVQALTAVTANTSTGAWSATATAALTSTGVNGTTYTLWAEVTDAAGNTTPKQLTNFIVDANAPIATLNGSIKPDSINDTGLLTNDSITRNQSPVLTGKAEPGAVVQVTVTGGSPSVTKTYTATANGSGDWTALATDTLTAGDYTIALTATDNAGNVQTGTGTGFKIDIAAPAVHTAGLVSGTTTTDTTPNLSGTSEIGSVVEVTVNGKTYTSATPAPAGMQSAVVVNPATGAWTLVIPDADSLAGGSYLPQIKVTDAAGNSTTANGTPFTVTVSLNGELVHDTANDTFGTGTTGTVNDNLTNNVRPKLSGSAPANSDVEVTIGGVTYTSATTPVSPKVAGVTVNTTSGAWELQLPGTVTLANQTYNWTVTSINRSNGNTSTANGVAFTVDAAAPADPTATLRTDSDSGDKGDGRTNVAAPWLRGEAEAGAKVVVSLNGQTYTTTATSQGVWEVQANLGTFTSGTSYTPTVTVTDPAGNIKGPVNGTAILFDSTAPTVSTVVVAGLDGNAATRTVKGTTLVAGDRLEVTVTMNEPVSLTGGRPTYTINVGGADRVATYDLELSNPSAGTLVFSYTVKTGDLDQAGGITASTSALTLPTGVAIRDVAFNALALTSGNATTPGATVNTLKVDAVAPTVSSVAIASNAGTDNTYKAGDVILVKVVFTEEVAITGTGTNAPFININVGGQLKQAFFDSTQANTTTDKFFKYTVLAGDNDNGTTNTGISIGVNPLSAGNGSIKDTAGNDATLSYATALADSASHMVDTTPPTVAITAARMALNAETATNTSLVTFTFSENPGESTLATFALTDVVVKNAAGTTLTLGTDYSWSALTGTGLTRTATLTPKANSNDALVLSIANSTFADAAGNANADALDADNTLTLGVDTVRPTVSMVSASGTQTATAKAGDTVTLTLTFTEEVNGLTTGDIVVTGGTGSVSNLVQTADPKVYNVDFRAAAGQPAGTTIELVIGNNTVLDLRGNNNTDGTEANNKVTVTVDTQTPTISAVELVTGTGMVNNRYNAGDKLVARVTFSEPVVLTGSGADGPTVALNIGGVLKYATFDAAYAGSSTTVKYFTYTVLAGDNDFTGANAGVSIGTNPVSAGNTGAIKDNAGNDAALSFSSTTNHSTSHLVDTTPPALEISRLGSTTIKKGGTETITFTFSEDPGTSFVWDPLNPAATTNSIVVTGGTLSALVGTTGLTRTATFTPTDNTASGTGTIAVNVSKFTDAAGNFNDAAATTLSLAYDTVLPALNTISIDDATLIKKADGSIETATLTFTFSEPPVGFTTADIVGYESNGTTVADISALGSLGPVTEVVGQPNVRTVVFTPLDRKAGLIKFGLGAGTFTDAAGNANTSAVVSNAIDVATNPPSVSTVTIVKTDTTTGNNTGYNNALVAGDELTITVEFTNNVKVTAGTPSFDFFIGSGKRTATLVSTTSVSTAMDQTTGGNKLVFKYTIPANSNTATFNDGAVTVSSGALKADGVTIVSAANAGTLAATDTLSSVLTDFATKAYVVDNVLPTVSISVQGGITTLDASSAAPTIQFTFSEAPVGFLASAVTVSSGTLTNLTVVPGTDGKIFTATYNAPSGASAIDLTTVNISITGTKVYDAAGNTNTAASNTVALTVDNKVPTLTGVPVLVSTGTNNFYNTGDAITFEATFSESVFVTGFGTSAPYLEFLVGATLQRAYYASGTGTNKLRFSYVVASGNTDDNGISFAADAIKLNSQTIKDQIGNAATLTHALQADATAHKVDTTLPTVTLTVTGAKTALKANETAEIVFTFSEVPTGFALGDVNITGGGSLTSGPTVDLTADPTGKTFKATYTPALNAQAGTLASIQVLAAGFTDAAGNDNPVSNTVNFTVDTAPPVALGLTLTNDSADAANVAGTTTDTITNNTALTVANGETGATVQYRIVRVVGGVEQTPVTMDWGTLTQYTAAMANATTTPDGDYKVYARQTDLAGNIGAETGSITFTKDTTALNNLVMALTADTLATAAKVPSGDFGTNSDKITSNAGFAATGAESGAVIQYKTGSTWSSTYTAPTTDGEKTVFVRQIDRAGNISAEQSFTFILDTRAPTEASFGGGLVSSDDTGLLSSDRITNLSGGTDANTLSLAGQSEAGTYIKVVVKQGATTVGTYEATSNATTGEWTLDIPKTALVAATGQVVFTYDIVSTDLAGNSTTRAASTYTTQSFTVDYTGPAGTNGKLSSLSDSGLLDTDNRTNVITPVLSGKAEANARVSVLIAGATYNTTADGNGDWSIRVENALIDTTAAGTTATDAGGTLFDTWTITATDAAGNASTVNGTAFTLDTKATATSLITGGLVKESIYDTGTSFSDGKTRNTRPNIEGTAEANAKVAVTLGGVVYNTTASSTGQWLISVTNPLAEGQHTPSIVVTDRAGNSVTHLGTQFTVDITAPLRPFITSSPMTNSRSPTITGTGEAGETIFVDVPGTANTATKGSFQVIVGTNGIWTLNTATALELNSNTTGVFRTAANAAVVVEAYSFDAAGNTSLKSSQTLTVDTTPPAAPVITSAPTTSDKMPAIVGTGEPGATITLTTTIDVGGVPTQVTTTAVVGPDGKWFINLETAVLKDSSGNTVAFTPLTNGAVLPLSVSQTDPAGNTAAAPATSTLTIDTALPVVTTVFDTAGVATRGMTTNDVNPIISGAASTAGGAVSVAITGRNGDIINYAGIEVDAAGVWSLNTETSQYKNASGVWVPVIPTGAVWAAVQQPGGAAYSVTVAQAGKNTTSVIVLDVVIPAVSFGSNPISQDDIVNKAELDAGPVLSGTAEPGSKVDLLFAGVVRSATVNPDGTWSYTLTPADVNALGQSAKGTTGPVLDKPITVRATDPAGNTNTATRSIAIDTVLPVLDLNRADGLSLNWAVPLVDNSEYGFDNGADVNTTAASLADVQSVNKITLAIDPASLKNGGDEVLLLGDVAFAANGNGAPASVLFAGVTWNVLYANGMFTFSATSVPATTAPVQAFFRNLRYQNKATVIDVSGDRIFEIQVFDTAGNGSAKVTSTMTNDKTGPVIDLDGGNASANRATLATSTEANTGVALVATSSLTDQNRIARVQVKVAGLRDGTAEKLVVGATDLNADGSSLPATVSDGANTWAVTYLASTGEFLFNLPGGTATTAQANALLASLKYKNTAGTATDGARTFDITAVDSVNNITGAGAGSSVVQSSVVINGSTPDFAASVAQVFTAATATALAKSSTGRVTTYDANGDDVLGDQFELAFSELVATAALTNRANWTASAGSLAGATITAVNPVTIRNVDGTSTQYARSFLFTGVTGHTTGTTFTVAAARVVGTAGAAADTAAAQVVFTMTDIVAPGAPSPQLNINQNGSTTNNVINAAEKAATTTVNYTHTTALAGDVLKIYNNGVFVKQVSMTLNATSTNVTLTGAEWGAIDGTATLTANVQDAAGNLSVASASKSVLVDTGLTPGFAALVVTADALTTGAPDLGDKIRVTFNEAVSIPTTTAAGLPTIFGTSGATAVAIGAVNGRSSTWEITLGNSPDAAMGGKSVTFTGVQDEAGNTGSLTGTVPSDVFNAPGVPVIGMVTTDNIISTAERGGDTTVAVALSRVKQNDVIKLFMDGVLVDTKTVGADNQANIDLTVPSGSWGADGQRVLTAEIQRGTGTVVKAETSRFVHVAGDAAHWSADAGAGNVLWFNTDTLGMALGATASTWVATTGGITANEEGNFGNMTKVLESGTGRYAIRALGGSALRGTMNWVTDWTTGFTDYSMAKILVSTGAFQYTFTHDTNRNGVAAERTQFGIQGGGTNLTLHNPSNSPGSVLVNGVTVNTWTAMLGRSLNNTRIVGTNGFLTGTVTTINSSGDVNWTNNGISIGGTAFSTSRVHETIAGVLGDQISVKVGLNTAYRQDIATYLGQKFMSSGAMIAPTTPGASYNLVSSDTATVLLNDVLDLANSKGTGNETITVAGSDWVNAGAGNDTVKAQDLAFRSLDGGKGFDTFALDSSYTGNTFVLADYVSNARGISGGISGIGNAADIRVNTNGYHKLLGFEKLDFSQSTVKQTVTIVPADVDQLAEKGLAQGVNVTVNATTSNLFVALGSNDYIVPTGFGAVKYGYFVDATGTGYERQYTSSVGTDTATLYVRSGDDAPDLGFTASAGSYSATGVTLDFSETMAVASLTASQFTINGNAATSATMTAGGLNLGYTPGGLTGLVRVIYTGTAIQDQEADQLRYKDITLGTSFADTISAAGRDTNQAILGGAGGDTITGGNQDDLLMGMSGNDNLTGGTGADTFRFIQFETGTDTITDFTKTQGDKLDLRGILKDSGFDADALSNLSSFLNITQSGNDVVLKVDDQGIGNFALPTQTIIMSGAANGTTNLYDGTALATLNQLIDQRVILV